MSSTEPRVRSSEICTSISTLRPRAAALLFLDIQPHFGLRPSSVLPAAAPDASECTQTGWTPGWEQSRPSARGSFHIHQCCRKIRRRMKYSISTVCFQEAGHKWIKQSISRWSPPLHVWAVSDQDNDCRENLVQLWCRCTSKSTRAWGWILTKTHPDILLCSVSVLSSECD